MAWEYSGQEEQINNNKEIVIGIPYKENFDAKVVAGLMKLQYPDYYAHTFYFETGQPVDIARNIMVSYALQRKATHVFYVDQDIALKEDTLKDLFEARMPIMGAVYFARNPPYNVVANINRNPITRDLIIEKRNSAPGGKALMEVHDIGFGATLINTRVFDRIAKEINLPFFCLSRHPDQLAEIEKDDNGIFFDYNEAQALNYRCKYCNNTIIAPFFDYRIGKYQENSLSEDYYFCKLARMVGFSVYLSIHVEVEHLITKFSIGSEGLTNSTIGAGAI